jgi:hypothetical protein
VNPATSQGLENIRGLAFDPRSSAADTLETVVSIGDVAPGQDRGTGNSWFGIRGSFSNTFAYWRRVMTAAFDLIAQMTEALNFLYQKLCASDARVADLEAQNQTLLRQLQMKSKECDGHAQRCQQAEESAELATQQAKQQLIVQAEKHKKEAGELWMKYTLDVAKATLDLREENATHQRALQAAAVRGVSCSPHFVLREQAAAAKLQAVEERYVKERNAMRAVQLLIRDSIQAVHEKARLRQRQAFRELEAEGKTMQAERDRLQDCFVEEWKHFGRREEDHVSMLGVTIMMARRNRRFAANGQIRAGQSRVKRHRINTPMGRVLTSQERALASKRRAVSDPYMSDACATLGRIHLPCLPRPLADDPQARARYDAKALLASMNSTRKAAILTGLNDRISRAMRYRRVYVKITREIRAHKRLQRRSIIARLRAAVQLNEITGSVKALTGFRRMEKQTKQARSVCPSGVCNPVISNSSVMKFEPG